MTFQELDAAIRKEMPESPQRRRILEGLHGIEEGFNFNLNFFLSATGHKCDEHGRYYKPDTTTFQVNEKI